MNDVIAEALAAGRTLIVPSRHRAAALAQAWARSRSAAGESVWHTPPILTLDAWLAREWQRARIGGSLVRPLQLLSTAQERRLWVQVLGQMEAEGLPGAELRVHAPALMRAATRARRSLIDTGRHAVGAEAHLLATALVQVDRQCKQNGWLVPGLARPEDLQGMTPETPMFAGLVELPPMATQLAGIECSPTLLPLPTAVAAPGVFAARDARAEVLAAADWCHGQLQEDPRRRLLVIDRGGELPLDQIGLLLWDRLAEGSRAALGEAADPALLGVEGGTPLLAQGLFADAMAALTLLREPIAFDTVSQLLRSAHFSILAPRTALQVELALRRAHRNRYDLATLRLALLRLETRVPGAASLADRFDELVRPLQDRTPKDAATWAARFDAALRQLGFPGPRALDSRDAQRLARWSELLDEFATLDAVAPAMRYEEAIGQLEQLARNGRHEAASLDASITLSGEGGDPLADYDGIWVMGLTATRWPEPPRPDPFVSLAEQRRCRWPESSVALRARQARFELAAWQARTTRLVLSYSCFAGDVQQLPSVLIAGLEPFDMPDRSPVTVRAPLESVSDDTLSSLAPPGEAVPLSRGVRSIELQHACPFRAQGELRLGAERQEAPPEGIDARLRGDLMHAALQILWAWIGDSAGLQALDEAACDRLCAQAWEQAQDTVLPRLLLPPTTRALARERRRGQALLADLLRFEAGRAAFQVEGREQPRHVDLGGPSLRLRIDRIDAFADGSRRIIDYKTGSNNRVNLDIDPPEPVQLAVYAAALKAADEAPDALALLTVSARQLRFAGGGRAGSDAVDGLIPVADWEQRLMRWHAIVNALAAAHVAGAAQVAPLRGACQRCHLQGFCRIGIAAMADPEVDSADVGHD